MSNTPKRPRSRTARKRLAAGRSTESLRVAGYGRLSLLTDESTSPERQREVVERYIKAMGWKYDPALDFYGDFESVSGSKEHVLRPEFNRLMADLDSYDIIVVYKLDRWTRRLKELVDVMDELDKRGIRFIAVEDGIDTGKGLQTHLVAAIIGAIAQMEAETIGERVASAQEYLVRNGRYRGGQVPYGWREAASAIPGGHIYRQDPNEVTWLTNTINYIFANDDWKYSTIVRQLNESAVEAPRAKAMRHGWEKRKNRAELLGEEFTEPAPNGDRYEWSIGGVKAILSNPILVGHGQFGEDRIRDDEGRPIEVAPPLIDETKYNQLLDRMEGKRQGAPETPRRESLLSGIATCGYCGRALTGSTNVYRCEGLAKLGTRKKACVGVSITKKVLDNYVLGWLTEELTVDRVNAAAEKIRGEASAARVDPFAKERKMVNAKIARVREDRNNGLYDSEKDKALYTTTMRDYQRELTELAPPTRVHDDLAEILGQRITEEALLYSDPAKLRRFVRAALDHLTVTKAPSTRTPVEARVDLGLVEVLATTGRRRRR